MLVRLAASVKNFLLILHDWSKIFALDHVQKHIQQPAKQRARQNGIRCVYIYTQIKYVVRLLHRRRIIIIRTLRWLATSKPHSWRSNRRILTSVLGVTGRRIPWWGSLRRRFCMIHWRRRRRRRHGHHLHLRLLLLHPPSSSPKNKQQSQNHEKDNCNDCPRRPNWP